VNSFRKTVDKTFANDFLTCPFKKRKNAFFEQKKRRLFANTDDRQSVLNPNLSVTFTLTYDLELVTFLQFVTSSFPFLYSPQGYCHVLCRLM